MTPQANILSRALGLPPDQAEGLVRAVKSVSSHFAGGRITMHAMMDETNEEPEFLKSVLGALLLGGVLSARFVPYHRKCDLEIGPDEASADTIRLKADLGGYPTLCPNCHDYLDGSADVVTRILFSLPPENA